MLNISMAFIIGAAFTIICVTCAAVTKYQLFRREVDWDAELFGFNTSFCV